MAKLPFDDALRTALHPQSLDFLDSSFFNSQHNSEEDRPQLPSPSEVRARHDGYNAGKVAFPELGVFVKYGPPHRVRIEEAQALQAVRRAFPGNEVPVPELVGWRQVDDISYIYMSLIPGVTLQSCWPSLTDSERNDITDQLARSLASLRSIRQDPGTEYIGALDHGPVQAIYFRGNDVGPFLGSKEFNDALQFWALHWLPLSQRPPDPFRHLLPDTAEIFFSHGDLHLDNIMVDGPPGARRLASIVDWGQAGWYPDFWEYDNMASDTGKHEWSQEGWIDRVLRSYKDEPEAMANYWSWRGPP